MWTERAQNECSWGCRSILDILRCLRMFWSHRQRGQTRHLDSLPWGVARPTAPALHTTEPWPCRARPHSWKFHICTSPEASFFRLSGEASGLRHVYQRCVSRYTPGLQLSFEEGTGGREELRGGSSTVRKARDKNREPGFSCLTTNLPCDAPRPSAAPLGHSGAAGSFPRSRPSLSCHSWWKNQCCPLLGPRATCSYFN